MQIQSKGGSMVLDYYPTKNAYNVINPDKVLKVLTFKGQTMIKRVISMQEYVNDVYNRIHEFKYVDNNVDHSNVPQFVSNYKED
tara:strand:- start:220 stop:471 length:252 start_codon:yes stop_codon:yes gene_type:complete